MFFSRTEFHQFLRSWHFWLALVLTTGFLICAAKNIQFSGRFFDVDEEPFSPFLICLIAACYAFGFFWWLREILGLPAKSSGNDLLHRWSQLASVASAVTSLVVLAYLIQIAWKAWPLEIIRTVVVIFVCAALPILWAAACTRYLEWAYLPSAQGCQPAGPRRSNFLYAWGSAAVSTCKPAVSLVAGAFLILLALFFRSYSDALFGDFSRLNAVSRISAMIDPTNNLLSAMHPALAAALRALPVLGVFLAGLALISLFSVRARSILLHSSLPAAGAAMLCLAILIENAIMFFDPPSNGFACMFLGGFPVLIWLHASRQSADHALRTHIFLLFLFLPLFLLWILPFAVSAYITPSHGSFTLGLFLLWWGFAQSRRPASVTP
jgi:hypothetical protein